MRISIVIVIKSFLILELQSLRRNISNLHLLSSIPLSNTCSSIKGSLEEIGAQKIEDNMIFPLDISDNFKTNKK